MPWVGLVHHGPPDSMMWTWSSTGGDRKCSNLLVFSLRSVFLEKDFPVYYLGPIGRKRFMKSFACMQHANFNLSLHQCLFPGLGCRRHFRIQSFPGLQCAEYILLRQSAEVRQEGSCSGAGRWPHFFLLHSVDPGTSPFILSEILQWELCCILLTSHCYPYTQLCSHITLPHSQTLATYCSSIQFSSSKFCLRSSPTFSFSL